MMSSVVIENKYSVVLGSSSKWRKEVLQKMGLKFTCISPDIDEKAIRHADPQQLTRLIANAKADALLLKIKEPSLLITSDQVIFCNGQIREKPQNAEECKLFLRSYEHFPAVCVTAVVVTNTSNGKRVEGLDVAKQHFHPIPEDFMDKLIQQGDVMCCCGGFTIEHMEPYLKQLEGEVETVTGLPKTLTKKTSRRSAKLIM